MRHTHNGERKRRRIDHSRCGQFAGSVSVSRLRAALLGELVDLTLGALQPVQLFGEACSVQVAEGADGFVDGRESLAGAFQALLTALRNHDGEVSPELVDGAAAVADGGPVGAVVSFELSVPVVSESPITRPMPNVRLGTIQNHGRTR